MCRSVPNQTTILVSKKRRSRKIKNSTPTFGPDVPLYTFCPWTLTPRAREYGVFEEVRQGPHPVTHKVHTPRYCAGTPDGRSSVATTPRPASIILLQGEGTRILGFSRCYLHRDRSQCLLDCFRLLRLGISLVPEQEGYHYSDCHGNPVVPSTSVGVEPWDGERPVYRRQEPYGTGVKSDLGPLSF